MTTRSKGKMGDALMNTGSQPASIFWSLARRRSPLEAAKFSFQQRVAAMPLADTLKSDVTYLGLAVSGNFSELQTALANYYGCGEDLATTIDVLNKTVSRKIAFRLVGIQTNRGIRQNRGLGIVLINESKMLVIAAGADFQAQVYLLKQLPHVSLEPAPEEAQALYGRLISAMASADSEAHH